MFKTVTTLTALLALFLLAFAPLVLAQPEDETLLGETEPALVPPEDPPGETAPAIAPPAETTLGETEPAIAPPAEDPPAETPPPESLPTNEAPGSPLDLENPVSLVDNRVLIDCVVVFQNLAQLEQWRDAQASDPAFQLELAQTEDFAQLCLDSGFTTPGGDAAPGDSGSDNASSEQYQGSSLSPPGEEPL
jgi:hypothetical protein